MIGGAGLFYSDKPVEDAYSETNDERYKQRFHFDPSSRA